jgi:hypothetical protein
LASTQFDIIGQTRQQLEGPHHGSRLLTQDDFIAAPHNFNFLAL